ncbi:hypothetical protein F2Q69_00054867 [Brassica cretica]|uniref:Uncharacterized protein n=1 Tax=Brassica cretica TaxID=69181 RepID=A0A8S9MZ38_BRACR|nr:hypothetical protein F2Q69_00054867 [Brassica cretica]
MKKFEGKHPRTYCSSIDLRRIDDVKWNRNDLILLYTDTLTPLCDRRFQTRRRGRACKEGRRSQQFNVNPVEVTMWSKAVPESIQRLRS